MSLCPVRAFASISTNKRIDVFAAGCVAVADAPCAVKKTKNLLRVCVAAVFIPVILLRKLAVHQEATMVRTQSRTAETTGVTG